MAYPNPRKDEPLRYCIGSKTESDGQKWGRLRYGCVRCGCLGISLCASVGVSLNFRQEVGRKKERREAHIPLLVSEPTISSRHSHSPNVNATNVSY